MKQPLSAEQVEATLTIQSNLIAGLFRTAIAQGQMTKEEFQEMFALSTIDHDVNGRLFGGPLEPLYQHEARR